MEAIRHGSLEHDIGVSVQAGAGSLRVVISNRIRREEEMLSMAPWFLRATERVASELAPATAKGSIVRTRIARALQGDFKESSEGEDPHEKTLVINEALL